MRIADVVRQAARVDILIGLALLEGIAVGVIALVQGDTGLMQVALLWFLAAVTTYYALQTRQTVLEMQADRTGAFVPLLMWQEPAAGVAARLATLTLRRHLNVVLWNAGPGHARITYRRATASAGDAFRFAHFTAPSLVPSDEQLTVRVFRDDDLAPVLELPQEQQESAFLDTLDVEIEVHYDDVVERRHYGTKLQLRIHFEEARGGGLPAVGGLLAEPETAIEGRLLTAEFLDSDPRPAHARMLPNCQIPECAANRSRRLL